MKFAFILVAHVVVALTLAPASNPCHAGSVTYNFREGPGAPHPGETGATISIASPPASPSSPWSALPGQHVILGVHIFDSALFPTGFTGDIIPHLQDLFESTGPLIEFGGFDSLQQVALGIKSTILTNFTTPGANNAVTGTWIVAETVPEPASAVQAGIASAIGLALAAFRKRKEARRQRPVGPLDANQ